MDTAAVVDTVVVVVATAEVVEAEAAIACLLLVRV
jgi:hypothetical protein